MSFEITEILSQNSFTGIVYFGFTLQIPSEAKFVAADESGDIYTYINKPELDFLYGNAWIAGYPYEICVYIASINFSGDWKDSLLEIRGDTE